MVSADSGRMCKRATFRNRAPAKEVPSYRSMGLFLKFLLRMGRDPMTVTMEKKRTMTTTLRIDSRVSYYIFV